MSPVNRELMANLVRQYGPEKGKRVYYALESEGKVGIPGAKPKAKVKPIKRPGKR